LELDGFEGLHQIDAEINQKISRNCIVVEKHLHETKLDIEYSNE